MNAAAAILFLQLSLAWASGFWDSTPPEQWTPEQVREIFEDSPWSRTLRSRGEPIQVHLASSLPMRQAEQRQRVMSKRPGANSATFDDYMALVEEGKYIVLAIRLKDTESLSDGVLVSRMQKDSRMRADKKSFDLVTYFPPSPGDPYLRLVFPRIPVVKSVDFTFVIPGATDPYRQVSFFAKDMMYRGKLEY
ncbi:hypothetical protein F183_A09690 [Bryobacterales bacterium F-183]|nr:hypothetical protein F183_A09690 [Bryobacterales bacterium F-183]